MNANMLREHENKQIRLEQIELTTFDVVKEWDSIILASKSLNIPMHAIQQCMLNKIDNAGGFKWKRIMNNETMDDEVCIVCIV